KQFFRERLFYLGLNQPSHWPRSELIVEPVACKPGTGGVGQFDGHLFLDKLSAQLGNELIDYLSDGRHCEGLKCDPGIQPVPKLRTESPLYCALAFAAAPNALLKTDIVGADLASSCIGGHYQDHVAKICLLAVVVGQGSVIHDLKQNIE